MMSLRWTGYVLRNIMLGAAAVVVDDALCHDLLHDVLQISMDTPTASANPLLNGVLLYTDLTWVNRLPSLCGGHRPAETDDRLTYADITRKR